MHIADYYDRLARRYDDDRFGNSYGQFLHRRETEILKRLLPQRPVPNSFSGSTDSRILDLACGTARLSAFATDCLDQSPEMLAVAREKWPEKRFFEADATRLPFDDAAFSAIFSLHFLMHLPPETVEKVLAEAHRTLRPGGILVVDFPSKKRRELLGQRPSGWHGATAFDVQIFAEKAAEKGLRLRRTEGVLMLPVQRFPAFLRPFLHRIDAFFGKSGLREWSGYVFVALEKTT